MSQMPNTLLKANANTPPVRHIELNSRQIFGEGLYHVRREGPFIYVGDDLNSISRLLSLISTQAISK